MIKKMYKDTRFYVDLDVKSKKILGIGTGIRYKIEKDLVNPDHRRIFLTKGQYNKLVK